MSEPFRFCRRQSVGFIGLGNMGLPMARNLLGSGHQLVLYDVSEGRVKEMGGGEAAGSPAEVASRAQTIVTMLPSGQNVMDCYAGDKGLFRSAPPLHCFRFLFFPFNPLRLPVNPSSSVQPGSLLIDCSTIAPEEARTMAGLTQGTEASFIDAPVSGGVCVCVRYM